MIEKKFKSIRRLIKFLKSDHYAGETFTVNFASETINPEEIERLKSLLLKHPYPCYVQVGDQAAANQELLNLFLRNQRLNNIKDLQENFLPETIKPVEAPTSQKGKIDWEKVSRAKINLAKGIRSDVGGLQFQRQRQHQKQRQQQMQQQQAMQTSLDKRQEQLAKRQACPTPDINRDVDESTLGTLINKKNIADEFKSSPHNKKQLRKIWKGLVGEQAKEIAKINLDRAITHVQKDAMAKIIEHSGEFRYGLVLDNLPNGFYLQQTKKKLVLCYQEGLTQQSRSRDVFKINLPKAKLPQGDVSQLLWDTDKAAHESINKAYLILTDKNSYLNEKKNALIDLMLAYHPEWKKDEINALIDSLGLNKKNHIAGLTHAFLTGGADGVLLFLNKMAKLKQEKCYDHFKETFLDGTDDYSQYVTVETLKKIDAMLAFDINSKDWWESLTKQHKESVGFADFNDLFTAFTQFKSEVTQLTGIPSLPIAPTFPGMKHMKVALDRLLFILGRAADKEEQLHHLQHLDLSAEGAYYAALYEDFKLATHAMKLSPKERNPEPDNSKIRLILDIKKSGPELTKLVTTHPSAFEHAFGMRIYRGIDYEIPDRIKKPITVCMSKEEFLKNYPDSIINAFYAQSFSKEKKDILKDFKSQFYCKDGDYDYEHIDKEKLLLYQSTASGNSYEFIWAHGHLLSSHYLASLYLTPDPTPVELSPKQKLHADLEKQHPVGYSVPQDHGKFLSEIINQTDFEENKKYFFRYIGQQDMALPFDFYRYIANAVGKMEIKPSDDSASMTDEEVDKFVSTFSYISNRFNFSNAGNFADKATRRMMGKRYPDQHHVRTHDALDYRVNEHLFHINYEGINPDNNEHRYFFKLSYSKREEYIHYIEDLLNKGHFRINNSFDNQCYYNLNTFLLLLKQWHAAINDYQSAPKETQSLRNALLQLLSLCTTNRRQLANGMHTEHVDSLMELIVKDIKQGGSIGENADKWRFSLEVFYQTISHMPVDDRPTLEDITHLFKLWQKTGTLENRTNFFLLYALSVAGDIGTVVYDCIATQYQRSTIPSFPSVNCEKFLGKIQKIYNTNNQIAKPFYHVLSLIADVDGLEAEDMLKLSEEFSSLDAPLAKAIFKAIQSIKVQQSDELPTLNNVKLAIEALKNQKFDDLEKLDQSVAEFLQRRWPNTHIVEYKAVPSILNELINGLKQSVQHYDTDKMLAQLRNELSSYLKEGAGNLLAGVIEKLIQSPITRLKELVDILNEPDPNLDRVLKAFLALEEAVGKLLGNPIVKMGVTKLYDASGLQSEEYDAYLKNLKFVWLIKKPLRDYIKNKFNSLFVDLRIQDEFLLDYLMNQLGELNTESSLVKALKDYDEKAILITDFLNTLIKIYNANPRAFKTFYQSFVTHHEKLSFDYHYKFISICSQDDGISANEKLTIIYDIISLKDSKPERLEIAHQELKKLMLYANEIDSAIFKDMLKRSLKHNLQNDVVFPLDTLISLKLLRTEAADLLFDKIVNMIAKTPADAEASLIDAISSTRALVSPTTLPLIQTLLDFYQGGTKQDWEAYHACIQKLLGNKNPAVVQDLLTIVLGVISSKTDKPNAEQLTELLDKLVNYPPENIKAISSLFTYRPSPSLTQFNEIDKAIKKGRLSKWTAKFDLDPYGIRDRETIKEQFDTKQLKWVVEHIQRLPDNTYLSSDEQAKLFKQFTFINDIGHHKGLRLADGQRKPLRKWSREQLHQLSSELLDVIRDDKVTDVEKEKAQLALLAIAREVYFRTNGIFPHSTQMIAALMSLNYPGNLLMQLNTGEGKSVLSPVLLLMEWAKGATVNFCTANADLAHRDQNESAWFYAFFDSNSQLITQDTPGKTKAERTVNYSTMANASLYRSNAKLFGNPIRIKSDKPTSLFIDESDADILDNRTAFNLANAGTENPYAWIYAVINEFIDQPSYLNIDIRSGPVWDVRRDVVELKHFLADKISIPSQKEQLKLILDAQLKKWLDAATTAKQHREGTEFVVQTEIRKINNVEKEVYIAVPLDKNIPQVGSTRENGIQQFLQIRLQKVMSEKNPGKSYYFPIDDESLKTASETAKNFIERHTRKKGRLLGISATLGSMVELVEQESKYNVQAFSIPPHLPSQREVLPMQIKPMGDKHVDAIIKELHRLRKTSKKPYSLQPTLIVCKDIEEAEKLHKALQEKLNLPDVKLNPVLGTESVAERQKLVKEAAEENTITISTSLLGRGTDIKVKRDPTKKFRGLAVIQTYLDTDRITRQIMGRTARNGALGCYIAIIEHGGSILRHGIDLLRLKGKQREEKLKLIYQRMDEEAAVERHYLQEVSSIQNNVLDHYHRWYKLILRTNNNPNIERSLLAQREYLIDTLRDEWQVLLEKSDPNKKYTNVYVRRNDDTGQLETEILDECVMNLETVAEKLWKNTLNELKDKYLNHIDIQGDDEPAKYYQKIDGMDLRLAFNERKFKKEEAPSRAAIPSNINIEESLTKQTLFESATDKENAYLTYANDLQPEEIQSLEQQSSQHQLATFLKWLPNIVSASHLTRADKTALTEQLNLAKKLKTESSEEITKWAMTWILSYHDACPNKADQFYIQPFVRTVIEMAKQLPDADSRAKLAKINQYYIDNTLEEIKNQLHSALKWRGDGKWHHQLDRQIAKAAADAVLAACNAGLPRSAESAELAMTASEEDNKLKNLYKTLLLQKQILQNKFIFGLFHDNVKKTIDRALISLDYTAAINPTWAHIREEAELEVLSESKSHLSLSRLTTLKNRQWQLQAKKLELPHAKLHACTIHTGFRDYSQITVQLDKKEDGKVWQDLGLTPLSENIYMKRFNNAEELLAFETSLVKDMPSPQKRGSTIS